MAASSSHPAPIFRSGEERRHSNLNTLQDIASCPNDKFFISTRNHPQDLNCICEVWELPPKVFKLVADPPSSGGSMFRIYRDVRFSPDKRPCKTHVAARFSHVMSRDVHAPGFYLHLEPSGVFSAAGIWHPDPATLARIRDFIVKHPAQWREAINDPKFRQFCTLEGDMLSRPPKGYDPGHPLIDDLKRKDFIAVTKLGLTDPLSPLFVDRFAAACIAASPLMRFLTKALGLQF
jgi:uncharacterized protein (TIGR02453 family)